MFARVRYLTLAALLSPVISGAQSLDLMIGNTGLSIGDSRLVRGVRLNYRDDRMQEVTGINATIWSPYSPARGHVRGLALGLPVTGARRIDGLGIGVFGVGTDADFNGLGVGTFGVGAGGDASGILLGGFGVGAGGDVTGLTVGGFGAGAGGRVRGVTIGGFGAGAGGSMSGIQGGLFGVGSGGDLTGLSVGGFGAGAGGDVKGLTIGGFGAGAGGDITGITIGGFGAGAGGNVKGITAAVGGVGAGGDVTGITVAGIGVGAGGRLRGLAVTGVGAGSPTVRAVVISLIAAGGHDVVGGVIAPAYFKIADDRGDGGRMKGVSVSAFNHIKGDQFGLSIGLLNYAWDLHGWQLGLLNYAANNPRGLRLLPFFNRGW